MAYKFQRGSAILSGALLQEGDVEIESGFSLKIGNAEMSETDLEKLDGITNGTAAASKALVLDTNKDVSGVHAFTLSGSASGQQQSKLIFGDNENSKIERIHDSGEELLRLTSEDATIDISGSHDGGVNIYGGDGANAGVIIDSAQGVVLKNAAGTAPAVSLAEDGAISGSGNLQIGGTVRLDGVGDDGLDVTADSFYFFDASDNNLVKRDTMADYATAVAGNGLSASAGKVALSSTAAGAGLTYSAGVLAVGVDDTGIEIDSDALRLKDSGVVTAKIADDAVTPAKMSLFDDSLAATDTHILIADGTDYSSFAMSGDATLSNAGVLTIAAGAVEDSMLADDVATGLAGDGLGASSGVLAVQVSGAIAIHSDYVGLSGSVAGNGLGFKGGADSISALEVDLSEFDAGVIASGDSFAFIDADDSDSMKQETVDDLATLFAGTGLTAASAVLSLDLNELSDAAVDVANDSIAIVDADDSSTKKESIADLVAAMAGAGLTATDGVLSADSAATPALKADGDELQEGYNYFDEELSNNLSASLPAAATPGDVVHVKAGNLGEDVTLKIMPYAAQTIDGESEILLESPYAAVSLVYVVSGSWRIV